MVKGKIMMQFALIVSTLSLMPLSQIEPGYKWAAMAYGDEIEFAVRRKGKIIGKHTVSFKNTNDIFYVNSQTKLRVKFLFFTAYRFSYEVTETWNGQQLVAVEGSTNDGGDKTHVNQYFDTDNTPVPTNHWNPYVLKQTKVFNTITGNMNSVTITAGDWEEVSTGTGMRYAQRYDYSGDLQNVSSWYDTQNRWVGLKFLGGDGSEIIYECIKCGS